MMSNTESLSAEDLRSRLYHSLREKGLVDALKSQLRNKLVSELRLVGVEQTFEAEPQYSSDGSLLHKASNSLVVEHLRRCHYDYSLSVFLPECGTPEHQLFTTRDLLQLLNISPHSRLFQKLTSASSNSQQKGFLWQLLCEIASVCGQSCRDSGVQTDATRLPPPSSLEEQLSKVDSYYSSLGDEHKHKWLAVEERLLSYQRHMDDRSKTELQLEMARFKENELSRMRMEEREKNRLELERIRREMDASYKTKSESLLERERHSIERLQKEQQISEKETYNQRQSLLEEIEAVRQREANMKRNVEINLREKTLWEEKMKTKDQLVKKREDDVRKAEIEYNQKLHDEIKKFKLEEQARLLERTKDLDYREVKVRENERRLDDELREVHIVKDELREKRKQCNELEGELIKAKHELISLKAEVELLGGKVREMVDYQIVKEDNSVMKRELDNQRMRIAELSRDIMLERQKNEELLREMTERASKPTPEVYLMQKEVDRVRNEVKQERAIFDHQKQNMDKRYHDEVERSHELLRKYEEQTLQLEEMNREIRDLRHQLGHTKTALTNEVYRKPKPSLLSRSESPCDLEAGSVDPTLIRTSNDPELLFSASHGLIDNILDRHKPAHTAAATPARSDDYNYSMDIVEDTKKRLRSLEREAENLDHHYQNFQYRMTSVHAALEVPPPVLPHNRSRVEFAETSNQNRHSTPPRSSHGAVGTSTARPLSSTPARQKRVTDVTVNHQSSIHSLPTHELVGDSSLINNSMSTVQSSPPMDAEEEKTVHHRPLSMDDLEHRPGSPDIVVVPAAASGDSKGNSGQERSAPPKMMSLDVAWKQQADADEERQRLEEEDRAYEEAQRRREEDRRRREQEAWEREQRDLDMLQGATSSKAAVSKPKSSEAPPPSEETGAEKQDIDPTMLKYMQMVEQQRHREKEVTKKAVDIWNKGRKPSQDKSPSVSEDISLAEDKSAGGEVSDTDFW